ncbi:uncharacterized protein podxl2 isoform X3 [Festucalex cinctus]
MIGYSPPSAPPDLPQDLGPHQVLEAELDEGGHFSGFGFLHSSVSASTTTAGAAAAASSDVAPATAAPETGTGTDFGLLGVKDLSHNATVAHVGMTRPKEEEGEATGATPTSHVSPNEGLAETSRGWMTVPPQEAHVVCVDWTQPSGHGYVILNMTHNLNCEEFRGDGGAHLLKTMERRFARRMNSPEGSWVIYLSKPTHQQRQMLMHVASEHGVMSTQDLLNLLGEMRLSLNKVGIQDYGAPSTCPPRRSPSQRSDYSKLFVVLVVIGSVCLAIITSGFVYICWQRRPPTTKANVRPTSTPRSFALWRTVATTTPHWTWQATTSLTTGLKTTEKKMKKRRRKRGRVPMDWWREAKASAGMTTLAGRCLSIKQQLRRRRRMKRKRRTHTFDGGGRRRKRSGSVCALREVTKEESPTPHHRQGLLATLSVRHSQCHRHSSQKQTNYQALYATFVNVCNVFSYHHMEQISSV